MLKECQKTYIAPEMKFAAIVSVLFGDRDCSVEDEFAEIMLFISKFEICI